MCAQTSIVKTGREPHCIWMLAGVVKHKTCTLDYECAQCSFDRALFRVADENRIRRQQGEQPAGRRGAIVSWQEMLKRWPLWKRPCLHHLKARIGFRACTHDYMCGQCDFDQYFNDPFTVFATMCPLEAFDIQGVRLPQGYYLHRGHCWVSLEEGGIIRVGFDDFALKVLAPFEQVDVPLIGKPLSRDAAAVTVGRGPHRARFLSPVSGVVTDTNPQIRENGCRAGTDPYTDGWVLRVYVPNLRQDLQALMIGEQASDFLKTEIERLFGLIEANVGPLAVDGGRLARDIFGCLPQLGWDTLTTTFLRTGADEGG
jgi:glycine cleavage system H lipoate-binding protein